MLWHSATRKFSNILYRMPRLNRSSLGDIRPGALIAVKMPNEGWRIGVFDARFRSPQRILLDPVTLRRLDPVTMRFLEDPGSAVFLSKGRDKDLPNLAFETTERLSYLLYETRSDDLDYVRTAKLAAATWYHPEWDWYINAPVVDENGDVGFETTDGMWGQLFGREYEAKGVIAVCDSQSDVTVDVRAARIKKGGWPGPKDWSPRGRLPGDR